MRIGLNLLFLIPEEVGGTETYSLSLIRALSELDSTNEYFLIINQESKDLKFPKKKNFHILLCPIHARNRWLRFIWEQFILPWQILELNLDVLHSLGYISPLILPCKSVATIHDLNYLRIPESFTPFTRFVQGFFVNQTARHTDRIIVVSEFIKTQLIEYLKISNEKIVVIHEAPKPRPKYSRDDKGWIDIKTKFGIEEPFILTLSSKSPHKNITRLIQAHAINLGRIQRNWQLVIAGHLPDGNNDLEISVRDLHLGKKEVIFTGFLPDDQLSMVMCRADIFVMPSLYEGFGLPILEAMRFGIPVACSSHGSLPEIAGKAALFFDPTNTEQIADTILNIKFDRKIREELIKFDIENLQRFDWEKAAKSTTDIYKIISSDL
jgi:glycosyltransferase involved in cell wall biosynthesis